MHAHCTELQPLPDQQQAIFCNWKGTILEARPGLGLRKFYRIAIQCPDLVPVCCCMEYGSRGVCLFDLYCSLLPSISLGCDAFFKIKYRLREHLRSHTQERLVACPTCGCMFSSNTKLFDHIHRQAEPEGELKLNWWPTTTPSDRDGLVVHHYWQYSHKCVFCRCS